MQIILIYFNPNKKTSGRQIISSKSSRYAEFYLIRGFQVTPNALRFKYVNYSYSGRLKHHPLFRGNRQCLTWISQSNATIRKRLYSTRSLPENGLMIYMMAIINGGYTTGSHWQNRQKGLLSVLSARCRWNLCKYLWSELKDLLFVN